MKIGLCCGAEEAAQARAAGCEYVELNFTKVARQSEEEYAQTARALDQAGLRAEAMNCIIPADFQLYSLGDYSALERYLRQGMARAGALGTQVVVFGSSGARRLPPGVEKKDGWEKLIPVYRLVGGIAAQHGVTIAVEPLNYGEDNAINTLREGLEFMRLVGSPGVRLLADMYHMGLNGEDYGDILPAGEDLRHCHIARPEGRLFPLPGDGYDYAPFFAALREIGYAGRLSIEAGNPGGPECLPACVEYLRALS